MQTPNNGCVSFIWASVRPLVLCRLAQWQCFLAKLNGMISLNVISHAWVLWERSVAPVSKCVTFIASTCLDGLWKPNNDSMKLLPRSYRLNYWGSTSLHRFIPLWRFRASVHCQGVFTVKKQILGAADKIWYAFLLPTDLNIWLSHWRKHGIQPAGV